MMNVRFVYLSKPKGLTFMRSQFHASYSKTLKDLERELDHLEAHSVTIQAGFPSSRIRSDGWPYSSVRPEHPGVVLQFQKGKDTFAFRSLKYRSFEENLRAISLTMDALRRVDRYGVVEGEQYQGFKQIAAPDSHAETKLDKLIRMRDGATTDGERRSAEAAIARLQGGAA